MKTELERHKEAVKLAVNHLAAQVTLGHLTGSAIVAAKEVGDQINTILNPPPLLETVEVVRWECKKCGHVYRTTEPPAICNGSCGDGWCNGKDCFTKLTGTVQQPKKLVERSVNVRAAISINGFIDEGKGGVFKEHPEVKDKSGLLTFTWSESV